MKRRSFACRRGNIIVLTALLMTVMIGLLAFAIDLGYAYAVRAELQRSADSAAIAAAWELINKDGQAGSGTTVGLTSTATSKAAQYAAFNKVSNDAPGLASGDVVVGYMANPSN